MDLYNHSIVHDSEQVPEQLQEKQTEVLTELF